APSAHRPNVRVVGPAHLARVVEHYARRPQVQERLTEQVIDLLERRLRPAGAMVVGHARRVCMERRGGGKAGATTRTSAWRGAFGDARTRQEFLDLLPTSAPERRSTRPPLPPLAPTPPSGAAG